VRIIKVSPLKRLIEVVPETTLDLLNIFRTVSLGSTIYSETSREVKKERADGRFDSIRMRLRIGVAVEKKTLEPLMRRVSFTGTIVYESRQLDLLGKHHTIHLTVGTELSVEDRDNFPRLSSFAQYYRKRPAAKNIICLLIDDEGLSIVDIGSHEMKVLYEKKLQAVGKREPEERLKAVEALHAGASAVLEKETEERKTVDILIFGPGIFVDDYMAHLKRNKRQLLKYVKKTGFVSDSSSAGVGELLRNGILHEYGEHLKVVADAEAVEKLIERMVRQPSMVAIGLKETLSAAEIGAAEKILVDESFLWYNMTEDRVEDMLTLAEKMKTSVHVISAGYEASDKVASLGGVAALLRYQLTPRSAAV